MPASLPSCVRGWHSGDGVQGYIIILYILLSVLVGATHAPAAPQVVAPASRLWAGHHPGRHPPPAARHALKSTAGPKGHTHVRYTPPVSAQTSPSLRAPVCVRDARKR